jgi:WD40 repeat protein
VLTSAGADKAIRKWDKAGKLAKEFKDLPGPITALTPSADGKVLSTITTELQGGASMDVVRQWEAASGKEKAAPVYHSIGALSVVFADDGKTLITGGKDALIRTWDAASGKEKTAKPGHISWATVVAQKDGKTLVSAGQDGAIRTWDIERMQRSDNLPQGDWATAVAFSRNDKVVVSGGRDGSVKFWDVASGNVVFTLPKRVPAITSLALESAGKTWTLAVGVTTEKNEGPIYLWDYDPDKKSADNERALQKHTAGVTAVAFSPDGKSLASASRDKSAIIWNVDKKEAKRTFADHQGEVLCLAWHPKGTALATGGDDRLVRLWNTEKDEKPAILGRERGHRGAVTGVTFAENSIPTEQPGKRKTFLCVISVGQDMVLRYWNFGEYDDEAYPAHAGPILGVAWNARRSFFVTASWDKSMKIWLPEAVTERLTLTGHTQPVRAVAISSDGNTVATASQDGTVRLWRGSPLERMAVPHGGMAP